MAFLLTDLFTTFIIILIAILINILWFKPTIFVLIEFKKTVYERITEFLLYIEEEMKKRKEQQKKNTKKIEKEEKNEKKFEKTRENTQQVEEEKKYYFTKETQVSDIDFETYDIRTHLKLPKLNSSFTLKNFMNLPSILRGDNHLRIERMKFDETNKIFNIKMKEISTQTIIETREIGIGSDMNENMNIQNEVKQSPLPNLPFELIEHPFEEMIEKQEMKKKKKLKKLSSILKKENEKKNDILNPNGFELRCFDSDFLSGFEVSNLHSKLIHYLIEEDFYQIGNSETMISPRRKGRDEKSTTLYLSSLKLIQLPVYLIEENIITHLDLSNNFLTNIPNWFFESMKNLTYLDLSRNYLNELPENFKEMKKLKDLYLSFNNFEYFPTCILQLTSLQYLYFNNNFLIQVPNDIIKLKYTLYELDFSYNKLIDLPDDFKNLKKMKFNVQGNRLLYYTKFEIIPKMLPFDDSKLNLLSSSPQKNSMLQSPNQNGSHTEDFEKLNSKFKEFESDSLDEEIRETFQNSRNILLLQLLDGERKYVRYLHIFKEIFVLPLMSMCMFSDSKKNQIPISKEELSSIIPKKLEILIKFSKMFLISMECSLRDLEKNPKSDSLIKIGNLFLDNMNLLKENFIEYPSEYRKCIENLKNLKIEKVELTNYLATRRKLILSDGCDFDAFLVLPLQRFIQYYKFLKKIFLATQKSHIDYEDLKESFKKIKDLYNYYKYNIAKINNKDRVLELSIKWKNPEIVKGERYLIREGLLKIAPDKEVGQIKSSWQSVKDLGLQSLRNVNLKMGFNDYPNLKSLINNNIFDVRFVEGKINLYLFNDIMVIEETSTIHKLNLLGKVNILPLQFAQVEISNENSTSFLISFQDIKKVLVFTADDEKTRSDWFVSFLNAIQKLNDSQVLNDDNEGDEEQVLMKTDFKKVL
eukprot:gene6375-10382_t